MFRNADNNQKLLFLLANVGFGLSFGVRIHQELRSIFRARAKNSDFDDPGTYTTSVPNYAFSADDPDWSPGAEATIGIVVFNNDYFSGQVNFSKTDIGLSANAQLSVSWPLDQNVLLLNLVSPPIKHGIVVVRGVP